MESNNYSDFQKSCLNLLCGINFKVQISFYINEGSSIPIYAFVYVMCRTWFPQIFIFHLLPLRHERVDHWIDGTVEIV